jgi:hypothetical protein
MDFSGIEWKIIYYTLIPWITDKTFLETPFVSQQSVFVGGRYWIKSAEQQEKKVKRFEQRMIA